MEGKEEGVRVDKYREEEDLTGKKEKGKQSSKK